MSLAPPLSPTEVLRQVAATLPASARSQVIVIGSLAAGYHFFANDGARAIRTKDVDCMFSPHAKAVASAEQVADALLKARWELRQVGEWTRAGTDADARAPDTLPMVRLQPPGGGEWFVELLGAPDLAHGDPPTKQYRAVHTRAGVFSICSFGFLALAEWRPLDTPFGVRIARPETMALANLLHHERIGPELMSGTSWKRSNKDLGRVLALAWLAVERDRREGSDDVDEWAGRMRAALEETFPARARELARRAGSGLRALLASPEDLDQALRIANLGLLASMEVSPAAFAATGRRFIADVIEPLEAWAAGA